ncbi:MAG: M28 family peptidase [Gemmatimonadota bacterium]|nr:MAG: M28 family peptidase [Gemmatimonadota bacterium]
MKRFFALLTLALVACESSPTAPEVEPAISEENILAHLEVLAHDSMFGRRGGSEYELAAAEYIREELVELGLEPGTPGYLQTFEIPFPVGGQSGLTSQNVLGVIPGAGALAAEWLVIGAHYDHVGYEQVDPDSVVVYNGADDNASGTALLLELARNLAAYAATSSGGPNGRRSIMVQAYGSEELGLVGSNYFCEQPTVSMTSVVAMVNFDMVGRLSDNGLMLIGASSSAQWNLIVARANRESLPIVYTDGGLMDRSDQACFYGAQKPVLFFHTGTHPQYHQPTDDVWLIDSDGMVSIGYLAVGLLMDLAERGNPPAFAGF